MNNLDKMGVIALPKSDLLSTNGGSFSDGQSIGMAWGAQIREAIENSVFIMAALCLFSRGRLCR